MLQCGSRMPSGVSRKQLLPEAMPTTKSAVKEEDEIVQTRISFDDAALRRCIRSYGSVLSADPTRKTSSIDSLLLNLQGLEASVQKYSLQARALERDVEELTSETVSVEHDMEELQTAVSELLQVREAELINKLHRDEYEVLFQHIRAHPPTSATSQEIDKLEAQLLQMEKKQGGVDEEIAVRRKQLQMILVAIESLASEYEAADSNEGAANEESGQVDEAMSEA